MSVSHYDVLGVSPDATPEHIRTAYVTLAKRCHPNALLYDMATFPIGSLSHEECWKAVSTAYAVLADANQRLAYDAGQQTRLPDEQEMLDQYKTIGEAYVSEAVSEGVAGSNNLSLPRTASLCTVNTSKTCVLNLEDYFYGGIKTFEYDQMVTVNGIPSLVKSSVSFVIWPGVALPGGWFEFPNRGHQNEDGGGFGMLKVCLALAPNPSFTWKGVDLHMNCYVPLVTALTEGKVRLTGVDGKRLTLYLAEPFPAHLPLTKRIHGEGMPRAYGGRGDLIIHCYVQLPRIPRSMYDDVRNILRRFSNLRK